jgi:hypothetical protein
MESPDAATRVIENQHCYGSVYSSVRWKNRSDTTVYDEYRVRITSVLICKGTASNTVEYIRTVYVTVSLRKQVFGDVGSGAFSYHLRQYECRSLTTSLVSSV